MRQVISVLKADLQQITLIIRPNLLATKTRTSLLKIVI